MEVVRNFNGYNNGEIAVAYSHLIQRLSNQNKRKIGQAFADLMNHGFITTEADADWKGKRAREYRLTFVNTTPGGRHKPATNDYKDWVRPKQKASITASPIDPINGDDVKPVKKKNGDASSPVKFQKIPNTAKKSDLDKSNNGEASSPHIYTIPVEQKKEQQTGVQSEEVHINDNNGAADFDSAVHAQIAEGWSVLSLSTKSDLARRNGVSECEIDFYIRGDQKFSTAKLMAIRSDLFRG